MERKIGEIFKHKGEWYQCVEGGTCSECSFRRMDCSISNIGDCTDKRKDGETVIFKKLKKVGEPHWIGKRLMQPYELFTEAIPPLGIKCFSIWHEDLTIELEIKQNQEDMEEKKLNLKEFDLEKAKAGKPVCTRDGAKARIICFDAKSDTPIIALVTADDGEELAFFYLIDGTFCDSENPDNDLMMLPEKHEGWANIYENGDKRFMSEIYGTKEKALDAKWGTNYVATVKIEWSE